VVVVDFNTQVLVVQVVLLIKQVAPYLYLLPQQ
jgi:hypothetical protein